MSKILINRWVVFLLILPHLSIYYFQVGPLLPVMQVFQLGIALPLVFSIYKRVNVFNILLTLSMFAVLLSTVLNGNTTPGTIFSVITLSGFCYYVSYATKNFRGFITGLYYLLFVVVIGNFLTMIVSPLQIDGHYLLGGKNAVQLTLLPTIALVYVYSYFKYKKLKVMPLMIILLSIASIYLSDSGTATVIAILTFLFVFSPNKISPTFNTYLVVYTVAFLSIVVFRLQDSFADFIVNVLQKDITFTGRTNIWDLVVYSLQDSWFVGLGRESTIVRDYFYPVSATHNGILQVVMFTGVVGLLLFVGILLAISKRMLPCRKHKIAKVLSFAIFAYMVIGLTESVFYRIEFWLLLAVAFDVGRIINQIDSPQINRQITESRLQNKKATIQARET